MNKEKDRMKSNLNKIQIMSEARFLSVMPAKAQAKWHKTTWKTMEISANNTPFNRSLEANPKASSIPTKSAKFQTP